MEMNPSYEETSPKTVVHYVVEPYAKKENFAVFRVLPKLLMLYPQTSRARVIRS
jgi:hypothetical protein